MILIAVGTEKFAFNRLMHWVDLLIEEGFIPLEEEVVIQFGSCTFLPNKAKKHRLLSPDEFQNLLKKARLIISHCGEGTIDLLAKTSIPFILVPRSKRFAEHVDDHQIELAEMLAKQGVPIAHSPGDLARFMLAPEGVAIAKAPSDSYAHASSLLEKKFGVSAVAENSQRVSGSLFGFWQKLAVKFSV